MSQVVNAAFEINKSTTLTIGWAVIFLFACSQVSIPLQPVPITLQTMGVVFLGLVYPGKIAVRAVFLYILFGVCGIPMFANFTSGLPIILGPSGGYIIGFLASAYVLSTINNVCPSQSWLSIFVKCLIGTAVIFVFGMFGLLHYMGNIVKSIQVGVLPFIIPGIAKSVLLVLLLKNVGYTTKKV